MTDIERAQFVLEVISWATDKLEEKVLERLKEYGEDMDADEDWAKRITNITAEEMVKLGTKAIVNLKTMYPDEKNKYPKIELHKWPPQKEKKMWYRQIHWSMRKYSFHAYEHHRITVSSTSKFMCWLKAIYQGSLAPCPVVISRARDYDVTE